MPEKINIENLEINDSNQSTVYDGPAIFSNFNSDMIDSSYEENFPYVITKTVNLKNVSIASGKALRVSDNPIMFKDVRIDTK